MSQRTYPSGARKRKKQAVDIELTSSLPKLSSFFPVLSMSIPSTTSTLQSHSAAMSTVDVKDQGDTVVDSVIVENVDEVTVVLDTGDDTATTVIESEIGTDPALWNINESLRDEMVKRVIVQNIGDFTKSERQGKTHKRYLHKSLFQRRMTNDEMVNRAWLVYSPSTGCAYCVPCMLFNKHQSSFQTGFSDWKNGSMRVAEHEKCAEHKTSIDVWSLRASKAGRIDCRLVHQLESERKYWREVLKRAVEVIKFLSARGLAFRGEDEIFGSERNGNYLGILELMAKFDPFLSQHIERYGGAGSGVASYLSKTICEELIQVMGSKIGSMIISEIITAKYFSISVDSTPDLSHVDQLTFIVRYVSQDGRPTERFLKFVELHGHGAANMTDVITKLIKDIGLNIMNCRGQSYDNASNMAGIYTGLQARIKELSPLAHFIPCAAHSLNLVGVCAAESCPSALSYFTFLQSLYNFLSASTYRWSKLKSALPPNAVVIKTLSATRWSARSDATTALFSHFKEIRSALSDISNDEHQSRDTRIEANGLFHKMETLEIALMTVIWNTILVRFNATNVTLQKVEIEVLMVVQLYNSLLEYVLQLRNNFDEMEQTAKCYIDNAEYKEITSRKRARKVFFDDSATPDTSTELSPRDKFRIECFNPILDSLAIELRKRVAAYSDVENMFSFLTNFDSLDLPTVRSRAEALVTRYPDDLESSFVEEFIQFMSIARANSGRTAIQMSESLLTEGSLLLPTFPNVAIAFRIFLTIPVNNCQGERSFSTLTRVKNHLRTSMAHQRLVSLSIMCIESQLLQNIDFADLIDDFANQKNRRRDM